MKTLQLSIIAISFVLVSILSQAAFAPMLYNNNDILEKFNANSTRMTKLVHDGAILITTQTIKKLEYKTGERITVNSELTNIGNKSMPIFYLSSPFFVVINYQNGTAAWANGPSQPYMEYSYNSNQTLKPNVPFTTKSPYFDDPMHPLILITPGNYTILSVADFYDDYAGTHRNLVWSKPIQITVLPEKYTIAEINKLPPLQQYMAGIPATNIKCGDGLELLIKTKTGLPVCVKPNTATKLIERGLATKPNQVAINESPQITTVIMPSGFDNPSSGKTYGPSSVKVVIGINNTVRWINKASTADTLTSDGFKESNSFGEIFGGSTLSPGDSYEFTFTKTGTFGYHGEPNSWQRGKVIVLQP